jgi:hypothetical protein
MTRTTSTGRRLLASASLSVVAGCATTGTTPATPVPGAATTAATTTAPRVFALRADALQRARARIQASDPAITPAFDRLVRDADEALGAPLVAVTHSEPNTLQPPSGDPHDYFSLSPYWWPDPSKPDGLPYIRRDGETNPESKHDLDQPRVAAMGDNVHTLGLAYYFTGNEAYAARAAEQLRTWFLDSATRMNPHLRYSQLVRGNPNERGSGIIDTRWFIEAVDAAGLVGASRSWSAGDQRALQQWFAEYLRWLRTSPNGQHEYAAKNNHGSWYAAQTASYALFTGDTAAARQIIAEIRPRIGAQIRPDGQQPIELERTRSFHYSAFNVEALSRLAEMGRHVGIDLWRYEAPEGGSLRRAIDHLATYTLAQDTWPGRQIDAVSLENLIIHLRRGNAAWGSGTYASVLRGLPARVVATGRSALLYPD